MVKKKRNELHEHLETGITGYTRPKSHETVHVKQEEIFLLVFHSCNKESVEARSINGFKKI